MEVLSFDHLVGVVTTSDLLAIRLVCICEPVLVIEETWVDLLNARLILVRLSVLLEMRGCPRAILCLRDEASGDGLCGLG